jgi:hypothetical protein
MRATRLWGRDNNRTNGLDASTERFLTSWHHYTKESKATAILALTVSFVVGRWGTNVPEVLWSAIWIRIHSGDVFAMRQGTVGHALSKGQGPDQET